MDPEALLDTLGGGIGPWAYALVGGLAFLETSAFVGLVAPGELAVVLGGVLAGRGRIELPVLLAVVWFAATAGDMCGFVLGRRAGRPFVLRHGHRVGVTAGRLETVERFFERHGTKAIVIGRFVGVVRSLGPFTAGASAMPARRFVVADVIGAGLWAATFTILGYVFADRVGAMLGRLHDVQTAVLALALVAAAAGALVWRARRA
jgi:membrane protein DedA with SNARE-associated domain